MQDDELDLIDTTMFLQPPDPGSWTPCSAHDFRFPWDDRYIADHGQTFSPWVFAKNAAALLGLVRTRGRSALSDDLARNLSEIPAPHLARLGDGLYVANNFRFYYLWREFRPPFYGAFMNAVTGYGLLQLYEATGCNHYLDLARLLLRTIADPKVPVPLMTAQEGRIWLHEYVWRSDDPPPPGGITQAGWNCAQIYKGHAHALLALMRMRQMTDGTSFDPVIAGAIRTLREEFCDQIFQHRYFSYCKEMPIYPDYGQKRAWHLLHGLALIIRDAELDRIATVASAFYRLHVEGRDQEIVKAGTIAARPEAYRQMKRPAPKQQ